MAEPVAGRYALTFDDGPCPETTRTLLQVLDDLGAPATMFVLGSHAHHHPRLVRDCRAAGMVLGNHTRSHLVLPAIPDCEVRSEIAVTSSLLERAGSPPTLFRPPYGATDARVRGIAEAQGLVEVLWTVDSRDWAGASADEIVAAADSLEAGGVLLLHDGPPATLAALPRLVGALADRGLRPASVADVRADGRAGQAQPKGFRPR